jgi:hypothetical protein
MPLENESEPWWPDLLPIDENTPRVIARLPFGASGNARNGGSEMLAIGFGMQQESGLDRTFLLAEWAQDVRRDHILELLMASGLVCTFFASSRRELAVNLIEIEGFVPISDARLDNLRAEFGTELYRLSPLGGYAAPLPPHILAAKD